ncbi:MAG: GNAT family N-acetyltransferase [Clostridia bacterium]|nr:GNAT family N-acetyltransferase [Clostridia bacterium]
MTTTIRTATPADLPFLCAHDVHISPEERECVLQQGRILLMELDGILVGWLRWGMFWDNTPFMNLLYLLDSYRGQGLGRQLVAHWEAQMRAAGHPLVMTSTQANEDAQGFYRRLGYQDIGGFLLPGESYELILVKPL